MQTILNLIKYPILRQRFCFVVLCHILTFSSVWAQQSICISQKNNAPRTGDFLVKHLVGSTCHFSDSSAIWSFCGVNLDDKNVRQYFFSSSTPNGICSLEQGTCQYYRLSGDTLFYNGFENKLIKVIYDKPELRTLYPMTLKSQLKGLFHGTGSYCDKYFLHSFGRYHTQIDKCGLLVTVQGDTLRDVLKMHVCRWVSNVFYPLDSIRNEQYFTYKTFPSDSIIAYQMKDSTLLKEELIYLYLPGLRYPIVENQCAEVNGQQFHTTYYVSPEEQVGLALDEENDSLYNISNNSVVTTTDANSDIFYTLTNDSRTQSLVIAYNAFYNGKLYFLLSDTMGRVLLTDSYTVSEGSTDEVKISYASLRRGQYVLYVCTHKGKIAEKFSVE